MTKLLYDFLADSPLFEDEGINTDYHHLSDSEIEKELERYREHVLKHIEFLRSEITSSQIELSIYFDTAARAVPPVPLLKQSALYYDRAILDDPLFRETKRQGPMVEITAQYLGYKPGINRQRVAKVSSFMKSVTPMIAGNFLNFAPISLVHEPPKQLGIRTSETLFEEEIPAELRDFMSKRVSVHPLERIPDGTGWRSNPKAPLKPTRAILVKFGDYPSPSIYHLFETRVTSFDETTRIAEFIQSLPDTPPDEQQFLAWVTQSINQSAGALIRHVESDILNASASGSLLFTNSDFTAELLRESFHVEQPAPEADIARLAMNLDLPLIQKIEIEDLMRVRANEGEAFQSFRLSLSSKLRDLRHISDPTTLRAKLQDYQHDLEQVQVAQVDQQMARLKLEFFPEIVAGIASLSATLVSPTISFLGAIAATTSTIQKAVKYRNTTTQNPAFFLWKLKQEAKK